ncbi:MULTISPECIES: hypothetical protein [unclassified Roseateles]|uniref:hypothetical protein n=1 Tax=unclassified Roseateles TaxID=2626991 RepID=UPI0006F9FE09|nr:MULTISPECIES: hypothetical protein [unclassified Roseateles]KQW43299.1 hypothetical protein ASC81_16015 [Pelomonas sp. Root405]KRA71037.1 hypothetical protein ASD88_14540 [Pelomonas sp. Root662]
MTDDARARLAPYRAGRYKPGDEEAEFLYRVYKLLREAPDKMSKHAKKRTFENAADGVHSWKVVCISEAALEHLATSGTTKTLRRAHEPSREWRYQEVFGEGARDWTQSELMTHFFEHDICALVTSAENGKNVSGDWSPLHAVPEDILCKGSFAIYAREKDVTWAKKLWNSVVAERTLAAGDANGHAGHTG